MKDIDLSQRIYGEVLVLVSSTTDCLSVQVSFLSVMLSLLPSLSLSSCCLNAGQDVRTTSRSWNGPELHCRPWAFLTRLMKHIIGCREDDSERHSRPHPAKPGWNRKEMEQWPWKQGCHHIYLSLLCPIPVSGTDIGSSYNPEFMSDVFKGMCFWWAESSRLHWIFPP